MSIVNKIQNYGNRSWLFVKKKSPYILTAVSIGLYGYSLYSAIKKTETIEPIKKKHRENMDIIRENEHKAAVNPKEYEYSDKQKSEDLFKAYGTYTIDILNHYKKPISTFVLAVGCQVFAMRTISKWYAGSMAVTAGLEKFIRDYRQNVIDEQGVEADRRYAHGIKKETVVENVKNEDGTEEVRTRDIYTVNNNASVYARVFDETNPNFDIHNPEGNKDFVWGVQKWANFELNRKGYLFLNDVLAHLGYEPTVAGTRVGWLKNVYPELNNDGYVCFEIINNIKNRDGCMNADFVNMRPYSNGEAPEVLLDFNVDGDIVGILERDGYFKSI